jgi:hypothetical protein
MATEAMQIANLTFHSADISDRRATMIQCQLQDGKYFHSVVMFYLRKRITLKIFI